MDQDSMNSGNPPGATGILQDTRFAMPMENRILEMSLQLRNVEMNIQFLLGRHTRLQHMMEELYRGVFHTTYAESIAQQMRKETSP